MLTPLVRAERAELARNSTGRIFLHVGRRVAMVIGAALLVDVPVVSQQVLFGHSRVRTIMHFTSRRYGVGCLAALLGSTHITQSRASESHKEDEDPETTPQQDEDGLKEPVELEDSQE